MATPQADWLIRGVGAGSGWKLSRGSMWRPPVSVRRNMLTVPGGHGNVVMGLPIFEEPIVALEFAQTGYASQSAVEAAQNDLIALLAAPGLTVTRVAGSLSLTAPARLTSFSPDTLSYGRGALAKASLAIPSVFLKGASSDLNPGAASFTDFNFATLAAGNAPVTDAIARFSGPGTGANISDTVSGTGLSWTGTLASGSYLYLDAANVQAWTSTSATQWTKGGTDVSGGLSYPVAGPLQIWPIMSASDPAVRVTKVTVTGSGGITGFMLRAAPSYL